MPISHVDKCVFIHIPKTGGTSLETALGMMRPWQVEDDETVFGLIQSPRLLTLGLGTDFLQHLTWTELESVNPAYCSLGYFSFAWVRNPLDRIVSSFTKKDPNMIEKAKLEGIDLEEMSFSEFVDASLTFDHVHLRPQSEFIFDQDGCQQVDFIGRFENFHDDFKIVCQRLNLDADLPHKNSSQHSGYESYYDASLRKKVQSKYEVDFSRLGYLL